MAERAKAKEVKAVEVFPFWRSLCLLLYGIILLTVYVLLIAGIAAVVFGGGGIDPIIDKLGAGATGTALAGGLVCLGILIGSTLLSLKD